MSEREKVSKWHGLGLLAAMVAAMPAAAETVLWNSGPPRELNFDGNAEFVAFFSGNFDADNPQRWAAVPFRLPQDSWLTQIDLDYDIVGKPGEIRYIIWRRKGLSRPLSADEFARGSLGAVTAGMDDPYVADSKTFPLADDFFHEHRLPSPLMVPAGDYYLTIFADGETGNYVRWLTGAPGQDESLEQDFLWRSAKWPDPGFDRYNNTKVQPLPGIEPDDRWNPVFTLRGFHTPEPSTWAMLLGLGLLALGGALRSRARKRPVGQAFQPDRAGTASGWKA